MYKILYYALETGLSQSYILIMRKRYAVNIRVLLREYKATRRDDDELSASKAYFSDC
jgi:hypothetical protein